MAYGNDSITEFQTISFSVRQSSLRLYSLECFQSVNKWLTPKVVHCTIQGIGGVFGVTPPYSARSYGSDRKYNVEIRKQLVRETFLKDHHEQKQNIHLNVSIKKKNHYCLKFKDIIFFTYFLFRVHATIAFHNSVTTLLNSIAVKHNKW